MLGIRGPISGYVGFVFLEMQIEILSAVSYVCARNSVEIKIDAAAAVFARDCVYCPVGVNGKCGCGDVCA